MKSIRRIRNTKSRSRVERRGRGAVEVTADVIESVAQESLRRR